MIKRVIGGVFAVAVIGVIIWSILGFGSYHSMLPTTERQKQKQQQEQQQEQQSIIGCDSIPCDSLQIISAPEAE